MLTTQDKVFLLKALEGDVKFFLDRDNINTMLALREKLGKAKFDEIIIKLRSV
jgi:hypothetical protein